MRHTLTLVIVYGLSVALLLYPKTAVFFTQSVLVPVMVHLSKMLISFIPYITVPVFVLFIFNGVQKVLISSRMRQYIPRMIVQGIVALFIFALIGIAVGVLARPGQLSQEEYKTFAQETQRYAKDKETSLNPSLVAFIAGNSIVSSSSAIQSLARFLNIDKKMSNSVFPLLLLVVRMSHVLYFSVITIFSAQLYGIVLSPWGLISLCMLLICVALFSIGTYGIASTLFCGIIFFILEIPLTPSLWVLLLLDIVISPMRNALATHSAMLLIALLHHPSDIHTQITHKEHV